MPSTRSSTIQPRTRTRTRTRTRFFKCLPPLRGLLSARDSMASKTLDRTDTCEAHVWRGDTWHPRREVCGKPAKSGRLMDRGGDTPRPACGIHLRGNATWWADMVDAK